MSSRNKQKTSSKCSEIASEARIHLYNNFTKKKSERNNNSLLKSIQFLFKKFFYQLIQTKSNDAIVMQLMVINVILY